MTEQKQDGAEMRLVEASGNRPVQASVETTRSPIWATPGEFDLHGILRTLQRRKWLIIITAMAVSILASIFVFRITPLYTATAFVEISPRQSRVVDFEAVLSGLPSDTATIATEIQVIRSRKLAGRTIQRLELHRNPEFNAALRPPGAGRTFLDGLYATAAGILLALSEIGFDIEAEPIEDDGGSAQIEDGSSLSQTEMMRREVESVVSAFLAKLSVVAEGRSRVINISFDSESPRTAAAAANALADLYIVSQLEAKFEATKRANEWLSKRVAELRQEVDVAEKAVERYRHESGLVQGEREVTLAAEQISDLSTQNVIERARLAEAEARLRQTEKLLASPSGIETAPEVLASPLIRDLRREEGRLERQVAEFSAEYGERHPTLINARAELRDMRSKIKEEVDKIIQGLRNEVSVARTRTASFGAALEKLKDEMAVLNTQEVQLRAIEREATASRSLLEILLARSKETSSQENFQQADANVLSYATIPDDPTYPRKKLLLLIALVGGTLLGVVLAFIVEQLDRGFRSKDQVERIMGVTSLGLLPALKGLTAIGKKPETYILERPASAFGEAIRSLHTNLLLSGSGQRPTVVLVASALPKEGKTTVVVSLARMLATIGQKVLVIDCDLRRPKMHKLFDVNRAPGLTDCLLGKVSLQEVIREDHYSGAHLIPAGEVVAHPPSLIGGKPMEALLNTFAQQYDIILLDSAPLGAVADTLIFARMVDETVFLVRWRETRREVALSALKQLQGAAGSVAGVLLTMVDVKEHAQYDFGDSGAYYGPVKKYYTG